MSESMSEDVRQMRDAIADILIELQRLAIEVEKLKRLK